MGGSKMLKKTSGSKVTYRQRRCEDKNELHGFHTLSHSNTSRSNQTSTSNATFSFSNLSQHLIVLNLVTFGSADFSLQCVLVETSADVDQDSGRAGVDGTAEDHITHAGGDMDPEP